MSATTADMTVQRTRARRRFFFIFSLVLLVVALVGFAPSFYLSSVITIPGAPELPPLPGYVILHGALMTLWLLLLITQTALVARGRRDLHKKLGIAGVVLALAIVPLGWMTIELSGSRIAIALGLSAEQLIELANLDAALLRGVLGLAVFAGCVLVAVLRRRNAATHGRLLLLASAAAASAALAPTRLIGALTGPLLPSWLLAETVYAAAVVAALALYDWRTRRRIHAVTLIGGTLLLLIVPVATGLAATDAGHAWFMGLFPHGA